MSPKGVSPTSSSSTSECKNSNNGEDIPVRGLYGLELSRNVKKLLIKFDTTNDPAINEEVIKKFVEFGGNIEKGVPIYLDHAGILMEYAVRAYCRQLDAKMVQDYPHSFKIISSPKRTRREFEDISDDEEDDAEERNETPA